VVRGKAVRLGYLEQGSEEVDPGLSAREVVARARAVLVPELNAGQLSLEVERILGRERVVGLHRVNGEPITPAEIAAQAETLVKGATNQKRAEP
jgi:2-oxoglutarate ferredoxin oxidoreductase subunit alpha